MINTKTIIFYDFETGSKKARTTQPLELAAVAINPRKLEVIPDSLFHSLIKPWPEDIRIAKGLDPIEDEALAVNHIELKDLEGAPTEDIVWKNFTQYTYQYNPKKSSWDAPIQAHFNGANFDMHITDRLCEMYDPWDKKWNKQKIFNPIEFIDLARITWLMNENNHVEANNMNAIREWLGIPTEGSHRADKDVLDGAEVLCRMMRLMRSWSLRTEFKF